MPQQDADAASSVHVLRTPTTAIVVESSGVPRILHWGPPIREHADDVAFLRTLTESQTGADGGQPAMRVPALLPEQSTAWTGTPGLSGHRSGTVFTTRFSATSTRRTVYEDGTQSLVTEAVDRGAQLALVTTIELAPSGVLRVGAALTNTAAASDYTLDALRLALPVPTEADEILDFAGRHLRERTPQRLPFRMGTHLREGRRGRTGSDASIVLAVGSAGFAFGRGQVWAVHAAWSGNHTTYAEQVLTGIKVIGGGELLLPGEVVLAPGESYTAPWLYAAYGEGLDAVAGAFHELLRARPQHPDTPRPVVLNTWEAVYFDHRLESLLELARLGAQVGVERFVLDDGWFLGRRDDTAGLGDWRVDPAVWPQGLGPLVDGVRALGMDFGLWFEPEMVNEDSELARSHPEWILAGEGRLPPPARHQQVLNLTIPEAYDHVLESISALVNEHHIDYLKWDHNRDLVEAGDRTTRRPRVHEQTRAVYALMDELRRRHPWLEIESCSSGGGRVDLAILERTDRVWASDCIDPLERQRIQRWTTQLLPPELIGSHVGSPTAHTTRRTHTLAFRAATALFGHFGIEWDLRTASARDIEQLAAWVSLYKDHRKLLHSGRTIRCDYPDPTMWAHGVVGPDKRQALFALVAMDTSLPAQPGRFRLRGLDSATTYRVAPVELSAEALVRSRSGYPTWLDGAEISGEMLQAVGLQAPMLYPEQALLFRLVAVTENTDQR